MSAHIGVRVVFCHGLESGPVGSKSSALLAAGYGVLSPDGRGLRIAARVERSLPAVRAFDPHVIVGSSYGGPVALLLAEQLRDASLRGVVLCAPALGRQEPPLDARPLVASHPTRIIHGVRDDVVTVDLSRAFVRDSAATLLEVDDNHGLGASLDTILAEVAAFAMAGTGARS